MILIHAGKATMTSDCDLPETHGEFPPTKFGGFRLDPQPSINHDRNTTVHDHSTCVYFFGAGTL